MANIQIVSSGSIGNAYILTDNRGKQIILDVGLNWKKEILKALNYDISNVVACFVTHNHVKDHTKSINDCIKSGIPTFGNADICENYNGCRLIDNPITIDGFKVQTFELVHNKPNNAFIIDTFDGIRLLYCTDTQYIPKIVKNINYALIECNHDMNVIIDNVCNDESGGGNPEYHQSIDKCIEYLKLIYNPNLRGVILCHLSDANSNAKQFRERVQYELGFEDIWIAEKDLNIELKRKEDF